MNKMKSAIAIALVVSGAACSRSNGRPADSALNTDLSLAAQQRGYQPLDSISAAERAKANALSATPAAPVTRTATAPVHRAPVHHSSSGSSAGSSNGSSGGSVASTSSGGTVVKHTQRDAAIGAGAGAVIGAISSKNKVKGGLIGAAVGGILGGVVGNNVDKTKKP
ncbi:MAG: outer rane lipoprotein [Gemmatimonadetes bacterium]|nr:outer rane lipoprotein [Gemmatimonadota bacterium]